MLKRDELVWWGLTVPIPPTKHRIGEDRLNRVLAALAMYASDTGIAWPSAGRLGADLGLDRRVIRDAFAALEEAGLIVRAPSAAKSTAWTFKTDLAGIPATHPRHDVAGIPATQAAEGVAGIHATHLAGNVAGDLAGNVAGIPATNRREEKYTRSRAGARVMRAPARPPHVCDFNTPSGYCGCGERDDGVIAEGSPASILDRRTA